MLARPTDSRFASALALLMVFAALLASPAFGQGFYLSEGESGIGLAGGATFQDGGRAVAGQVGYSFGVGPRIDVSLAYSRIGGLETPEDIDLRQRIILGQVGAYAIHQGRGDFLSLQISTFLGQSKVEKVDDPTESGNILQTGIGLTLARDLLPESSANVLVQVTGAQNVFLDPTGEEEIQPQSGLRPSVGGGLGINLPFGTSGVSMFVELGVSYNPEVFSKSGTAGLVFRTFGGR